MMSRSAQQRPSSRPNILAKIVDPCIRSQRVGNVGGGYPGYHRFFLVHGGITRNLESLWHPG